MDQKLEKKHWSEPMNFLKRKNKVIIILLIIAVIAGGFAVYQYTRPKEVTNFDVEFEVDQEKPEEEETPGGVEEGIQIPGYESITIPAGTTEVSVELMNPEENNVYFEISFYLPETDETIYTSKMIQPGQHLYEITLDKAMEAGEYPLTIRYATYSADEAMTPRNGAEVNCTLIVR